MDLVVLAAVHVVIPRHTYDAIVVAADQLASAIEKVSSYEVLARGSRAGDVPDHEHGVHVAHLPVNCSNVLQHQISDTRLKVMVRIPTKNAEVDVREMKKGQHGQEE